MAIIYDPTTDTAMGVGATSKAAYTTLYDSAGNVIESMPLGYSPPTFAYMTSAAIATVTANNDTAMFVNKGTDRRIELRQVGVWISTVQGATAVQSVLTMRRTRLLDLTFTTGNTSFGGVSFGLDSENPPSAGRMHILATGLASATQYETADPFVVAMPDRASSRVMNFIRFQEEPLVLEYLEALVFRTTSTWDAGAGFTVQLWWDESAVS